MSKYIDLTGLRFGRWVVQYKNIKKSRKTLWVCKCDCGTVRAVDGWALKSGKSQSCGCLGTEHRVKSVRKHNETSTRLYRIWQAMRGRCKNSNNAEYYLYGSRGISVCKEWDDFRVFRDWAMSNGYRDDLTISGGNLHIGRQGRELPHNTTFMTVQIGSDT